MELLLLIMVFVFCLNNSILREKKVGESAKSLFWEEKESLQVDVLLRN